MENTGIIPGWCDEIEARQKLRAKNTKLWKLRKDGKLIYAKIGNRTFYKVSSIESLLESNTVRP